MQSCTSGKSKIFLFRPAVSKLNPKGQERIFFSAVQRQNSVQSDNFLIINKPETRLFPEQRVWCEGGLF